MKVLIFTSQFCSGAAERLGAELAVDLNTQGVHADVMSMYSKQFENSNDATAELLRRGVPEVLFLDLRPHPSIYQIVRAIFRLARMIRRHGYRIVETSSLTPGIIASWACWIGGAHHVYGIHHTFKKNEDTGLRFRLFLHSVRCLSRTRYYAVSDFVKMAWLDYSGVRANVARTVLNSIVVGAPSEPNVRARVRGELGIDEAARLVLCVARLAAYKRQDLVVQALAPICESENLVILFLGKVDQFVAGTPEMLARIDEEIASNLLEPRVKFLGQRDDVHDIMRAADLLVHAASREPFGLVLAEALAVGLPVVSTNAEGIPEVLCDTDSMMVPPNDPVALRQAVLKVLSRSPNEVAQAKARGENRAAMFGQRARTTNMIELFEDVVSGRF